MCKVVCKNCIFFVQFPKCFSNFFTCLQPSRYMTCMHPPRSCALALTHVTTTHQTNKFYYGERSTPVQQRRRLCEDALRILCLLLKRGMTWDEQEVCATWCAPRSPLQLFRRNSSFFLSSLSRADGRSADVIGQSIWKDYRVFIRPVQISWLLYTPCRNGTGN